jgi:mRNA interferase HigB
MRVISKSRLRHFWESPKGGDSSGPLRAWYTHISDKSVAWQKWSDVKAVFGSADLAGNCVVFNIGGNKYRLIARILYASQKVFILAVMTHKEYEQGNWRDDCGCFSSPPTKPPLKKTVKKRAEKER